MDKSMQQHPSDPGYGQINKCNTNHINTYICPDCLIELNKNNNTNNEDVKVAVKVPSKDIVTVEGEMSKDRTLLDDRLGVTESENLLNQIISSREARIDRTSTPCSECGRQHHRPRTPWTNAKACNIVAGLDVDAEAEQGIEMVDEEVEGAAWEVLMNIPDFLISVRANRLLLILWNLVFSFSVGIYFDEKFLRILYNQLPQLYPPPLIVQHVHFIVVVVFTFASLQRMWGTFLTTLD